MEEDLSSQKGPSAEPFPRLGELPLLPREKGLTPTIKDTTEKTGQLNETVEKQSFYTDGRE